MVNPEFIGWQREQHFKPIQGHTLAQSYYKQLKWFIQFFKINIFLKTSNYFISG